MPKFVRWINYKRRKIGRRKVSSIDIVELILSDWHDTGGGTRENRTHSPCLEYFIVNYHGSVKSFPCPEFIIVDYHFFSAKKNMDLSSGWSLWLCFSVGVELMSFGVKKVVTIESSNLGRYLGRNGLFSGNFWPLYNLYNLTSSQSILDNKPETKRQRSIYVTLSDSDNVFNLNFHLCE